MRKKLRRCLVPSTSCWSCRGWETRSQTGICPSPSADGFISANKCVLTLPSNVTFNRFTVCQWNCRPINTNLDQLVQHVSRHQFEVVCLRSLACPRVACPDWKGITTRQSSVRSLRGTMSWPAYTSDTTSSLATNRSSQVLPTGIPAEWGFVLWDSWISWLWTATPPSHAPVPTGWLSWEAKADA